MRFGSPGLEVQAARAVYPLLQDLSIYVNSATGSDSNPGTAALPFATLARAWNERLKYGEIRSDSSVSLRIKLIGAGPYVLPNLGASVCGAGGNLAIMGDAPTVATTGTATGDMVANVLATSATGGTNNLRDKWLKMTSGACADCVFLIVANTANTISVANMRGRTTNGAILNGDTWQVITPTTRIDLAANPVIGNWIGLAEYPDLFTQRARHAFYNIKFTSADFSRFETFGSQVGLYLCELNAGASLSAGSFITAYGAEPALFELPTTRSNTLTGAGISCTGGNSFTVFYNTVVVGVISTTAFVSMGGGGSLSWAGGRFGQAASLSTGASIQYQSSGQLHYLHGTVTVNCVGAYYRSGSSAVVICAVTSGPCFKLQAGGFAQFFSSHTGGTTDAAAAAIDVTGGGRCVFVSVLPLLTGGTAGSDLRTSNVAIAANAVLNAAKTAVGNAADALLGESLARS